MKIRDLLPGDLFYFDTDSNQTGPWEYRGNGWYGWPYSGGPYYSDGNPETTLVADHLLWSGCDACNHPELCCFA